MRKIRSKKDCKNCVYIENNKVVGYYCWLYKWFKVNCENCEEKTMRKGD